MNQYNLTTEEITKVITLYSKISSPEKRIYAQGYLNGLSAVLAIESMEHNKECKSAKKETA